MVAVGVKEARLCVAGTVGAGLTYCKVIHSSYVHWGQQYLTAAITITLYTAAKLPPLPIQRCQPLALDSDFSFILVKREDWFCIIAPCCTLKMTPALHTCPGLFFFSVLRVLTLA